MLGVLLATGLLKDGSWQLAASPVLAIAGTEIRVRVEDRLLAARFGAEFGRYRASVPAYIPFIREKSKSAIPADR